MNQKKEINVLLAVLPIITVIVLGLMSVLKWKAGMIIPIMGSILVASIIGKYLGFSWKEIQASYVEGVSSALPALFILFIVGSIIGSWIAGGVIPSLIYYSLKIISPKIFIPAAAVVTAVIATATGTSFTSIATVGLALMATGLGMGFPAPLLAGAIISGAYFGDSMSPLSDTTNLSSAVSGCTLFELIDSMIWSGVPAFILAVIAYYFTGIQYVSDSAMNSEMIQTILGGLNSGFVIHPGLLLIPLVTIIFSVKKLPAIPSLVVVSILGALAAILVQGAGPGEIFRTMTSGFKSDTGVQMVDSLLTRGGIASMGGTVIVLIIATALGGVLEKIGALDAILKRVMKRIKSTGQLILVTMISSLAVGLATGAQLLAILLPARMFSEEYKTRKLHSRNLARVSQSIGAICINLVPWSVPCIFAGGILGVEPTQFIPYIFFAYTTAAMNLIYGFTGWTIIPLDEDDVEKKFEKETVIVD